MRQAPLLAVAAAAFLAAAPARAAKVLIIGDSHTVSPFGQVLDRKLQKDGHETAVYAVCGASAGWWVGPKRGKLSICYALHGYGEKGSRGEGAPDLAAPLAAELLAQKADLVVFALGSNGPGATPSAAVKLVQLVPAGSRCMWIGPPPMPSELAPIGRLYNELPQALSAAHAYCEVKDSRAMECPTDKDPRHKCVTADDAVKDHFYNQAGRDWGAKTAELVEAVLP